MRVCVNMEEMTLNTTNLASCYATITKGLCFTSSNVSFRIVIAVPLNVSGNVYSKKV